MTSTTKSAAVTRFRLASEFQRLRGELLQEEFADRLDRPLAYWALPNDRRLPLAFLDRPLRDLLNTPFEELSATPGIGHKKIGTFVELLARAANKRAPVAWPVESVVNNKPGERPSHANGSFDPSAVSEGLWEEWRDTVRRHDIGYEKLGRLAPSLQSLPTVIWNTPLSEYCDYTIAEIRNMKTHGEKRVRTILQAFHAVNQMLGHAPVQGHLTVRLIPKRIISINRWIAETVESANAPSRGEVRARLIVPLLEQLRLDAGPAVAKLAGGRLGVTGDPQPVRHQSRRMGVTRARVYQLLEDCAMIMAVRWPEGGYPLRSLQAHLETHSAPSDRLDLVRATIDLFFPDLDALANRGAEREATN
jgi:hypothetical protein